MAQEHLAGSPGELIPRILTLFRESAAEQQAAQAAGREQRVARQPDPTVPTERDRLSNMGESVKGAASGVMNWPGIADAGGMDAAKRALAALLSWEGLANQGKPKPAAPTPAPAGALPTDENAPNFLSPNGPVQMGPQAPVFPNVPPQAAPQGALPAGPTRRRPAAAKPGALPSIAPPPGPLGLTDVETPENVTVDQPSQPAEKTTPKSQISYGDRYREGLKGIPSADGAPMSDQQRNNALLEAGLAIMAASAKPGAYALGAVGEGGQKGTAVMRDYEKQNREDALRRRNEARDDLKSGIGFDEMDANRDYRERDMVERITDRRERTKHEGQRIDLLKKQVEEAGWTIEDGPNGRRVAVRAKTGETRELPLRNKPERNANVEFYSWLMADPKRQELFLKEKTDKGMTERQLVDQYIEAHKASAGLGGPQKTTEEVMNDAIRWARSQRGATNSGGGATNTPSEPKTQAEANEQARLAVEKGLPLSVVNKRMQERGWQPYKP